MYPFWDNQYENIGSVLIYSFEITYLLSERVVFLHATNYFK